MKKYLYSLVCTLCIVSLVSCSEDDTPPIPAVDSITASMVKVTEFPGATITVKDNNIDVVIPFEEADKLSALTVTFSVASDVTVSPTAALNYSNNVRQSFTFSKTGCTPVTYSVGVAAGDDPLAEATLESAISYYDKYYGLDVSTTIDRATWGNDGDNELVSRPVLLSKYTESAAAYLQFLRDEVFSIFGDKFIKETLPATIFLTDSVVYDYSYEDWGVYPPLPTTLPRALAGDIAASNHMTLAVGRYKDALENKESMNLLKEELISLVVERMFDNSKFTEPTNFIKLTEDTYKKYLKDILGTTGAQLASNIFYRPSISYAIKETKTLMPFFFTKDPSNGGVWWHCGTVRPIRYGMGIAYMDVGVMIYQYLYFCMTYKQDFGDIVGFITCKTAAEKEAFYTKIKAANISEDKDNSAYGNPDLLKQKIELVKTYMSGLGVTLKEPTN